MKKILILASSALLLLAGCAKELQSLNGPEGGLQTVSFTAQMAGDATKAAADGDGAAASVNRCIMEIYYGDDLFTRMYAPVSNKKASFTTQLVSNRTYTVAFWADHVASAASEAGLIADLYYTTNAEGGLKAVALKGTYAGNDDARDAFFYSGSYTVAQGGSSFDVTLKRPFAQINVITTDWNKVTTVSSLKPTNVDVTVKNPYTVFNAVTGEASTTVASINYNTSVYSPAASGNEKTLSMDYLFAATEKQVIDIDFKAQKSGDTDVAHTFTSIPYQRNYRTNIKGALLTSTGKWNVTVDPIWEGEHAQIVEVADIKSANEQIAANTDKTILDVKFSAKPNDSGKPTGTPTSTSRAILTTPLASGSTLSVEVMTNTESLYVGDYQYEYDVDNGTVAANTAVVNINVPSGATIGTLVINAPSKTVLINGKQVASVGSITNLDAITSDNTLVIEANQSVGTLTLRQGAVKIHGSVNTVVVDVAPGKHVYVRDCEGLSQAVYTVLEPYIDIDNGYSGVKKGEDNYDIVAGAAPYVAQIGENKYYSFTAAVDAVLAGQTIQLLANAVVGTQYTMENALAIDTDNVTLDLNGKKLTLTENLGFVISADNVVVKNGTLQAGANQAKSSGINSYAIAFAHMTQGQTVDGIVLQDVIIKGGIFVGSSIGDTIYEGSADITLKNCDIESGDWYDIYASCNSNVVVESGKYFSFHYQNWEDIVADDNSTISLKGGIFDSNVGLSGLVASGYKLIDNKDSETKTKYPYAVVADPFAGKVAKIGDVGYSTLQDAFSAVKANETITLLEDVTLDDTVTYDNPLQLTKNGVTVDLNSKNITVSSSSAFIIRSNNVVVKNGKLTAGPRTPTTQNPVPYINYTIKAEDATNVTFQNITSIGGINVGGSSVIIENCDVTAAYYACIMLQSGSSAQIKGGKYYASDYRTAASSVQLAMNSSATATIDGGDFFGNLDFYDGTTYNIKAGTFKFQNVNKWQDSWVDSGSEITVSKYDKPWNYRTVVKK